MAHGVAINGEALRMARLRKGWSMRTLAKNCKPSDPETGPFVDYGNISRYEQGSLRPSAPTLLAIATALDLDVADLLADEQAA